MEANETQHRFASSPGAPVTLPGAKAVFYDAELILHFGFDPPVGVVRVLHYVAEWLATQGSVDLRFVLFDHDTIAFRPLDSVEEKRLDDILFRRYGHPAEASDQDAPAASADPPMVTANATERRDGLDAQEANGVSAPRTDLPVGPANATGRRGLIARLLTASRISRGRFSEILSRDLLRLLPIQEDDPLVRRIRTRILRRSLFGAGRAGHLILLLLAHPLRSGSSIALYLGRPDSSAVSELPEQVSLSAACAPPPEQASVPPSCVSLPREQAAVCRFRPGDALVLFGSTWDYLDYAYLTQIVQRDGVRLISIIYDVIAMELPFVMPRETHIYHRYWVELGHLAAHLVAISRHSQDTYRRFICEPNDLDPPISYAHLPNFLYERHREIGEKEVAELTGRRFVVYCSTIETRKNHQLLLHLWDRLRHEIDSDVLPVLVFVGNWGWGTEIVRLLSERNWRLQRHLCILNNISDPELIWLYRHARFTVFPSFSEGFGWAAAESLSFGTPVVVSNCPALVEATNGLMPAYDPLDFPAWLAEMRRLILDDDYLVSLREKATCYECPAYDGFAQAVLAAIKADGEAVSTSGS